MTDGPLDAEVLRAIVRAGRLSTAQLNRMCHSTFGQDLATISNAPMPGQQAEEMIAYAVQYGADTRIGGSAAERDKRIASRAESIVG